MFVLQQSSDRHGWVSVDDFPNQGKAEKASQDLADYTGKKCRVVELVQRSVQTPKKR